MRAVSTAAYVPGSALHVFSLLATQDYAAAVPVLNGSALAAAAAEPPSPHTPLPTGRSVSGAGGQHSPTSHRSLSPQVSQQHTRNSMGRAPFVPQVGPDGAPLKPAWHATLLMVAAHRAAADAPAVGALGDRLWGDHSDNPDFFRPTTPGTATHAPRPPERDRTAAHICYMLAGRAVENPLAPGSRFVLPGADHEARPGAFVTAQAVQMGELHAWCLQQSMGVPMYSIAPYYMMVRARHRVCRGSLSRIRERAQVRARPVVSQLTASPAGCYTVLVHVCRYPTAQAMAQCLSAEHLCHFAVCRPAGGSTPASAGLCVFAGVRRACH